MTQPGSTTPAPTGPGWFAIVYAEQTLARALHMSAAHAAVLALAVAKANNTSLARAGAAVAGVLARVDHISEAYALAVIPPALAEARVDHVTEADAYGLAVIVAGAANTSAAQATAITLAAARAVNQSYASAAAAQVFTDVMRDALGAGNRVTGNATSLSTSWQQVVGNNPNRYLPVVVVDSHAGWQNVNTYTARTCTTNLPSAGTVIPWLGSIDIGPTAGQMQGAAHLYALAGAAVGTHTITVLSNTGSQLLSSIMGNSGAYYSVGSVGAVVSSQGNPMNQAIPSDLGDIVFGVFIASVAPTSLQPSGAVVYSNGGSVGGQGDYMRMMEIAGEADGSVSVTHNIINFEASSFIGINMNRL